MLYIVINLSVNWKEYLVFIKNDTMLPSEVVEIVSYCFKSYCLTAFSMTQICILLILMHSH